MAKLIAKCAAFTDGRSMGHGTRLGEDQAVGEANTRETFAKVVTLEDGSGYVSVTRGGRSIRLQWNAERHEDGTGVGQVPLEVVKLDGHAPEAS